MVERRVPGKEGVLTDTVKARDLYERPDTELDLIYIYTWVFKDRKR